MFSKSSRVPCDWLIIAFFVFTPVTVRAQTIKVVGSWGFAAAYKLLAPEFEKATGYHLIAAWGPSMGTASDAIPARLARGESYDVVIMIRSPLDKLAKKGEVLEGSKIDLASSRIGLAVRAGAPIPDIRSVAALRRTLLQARSVAYSDGASGIYVSSTLFKRLGIEKEMASKIQHMPGTRVGPAVARGQAEIGFQQMSELVSVQGITIVGPIPDEVQKISMFSAGIVNGSKAQKAGRALIRFLSSPAACPAMQKSGLDPVACSHQAGSGR